MYKIILFSIVIFSGCSNITFNATMCNEIASDPHSTVPEECRVYNEQEAEKAFNKPKEKISSDEIIEFNKSQD